MILLTLKNKVHERFKLFSELNAFQQNIINTFQNTSTEVRENISKFRDLPSLERQSFSRKHCQFH